MKLPDGIVLKLDEIINWVIARLRNLQTIIKENNE